MIDRYHGLGFLEIDRLCGYTPAWLKDSQSVIFAQWRTKPVEFRVSQPNKHETRRRGLFALLAFTLFVGVLVWLHASSEIFWLASMVPSLWNYVRSTQGRLAPEPLKALMDLPNSEMQFPVDVTLSASYNHLGTDSGVVTFSGDLLHFEGKLIAFDLPSPPGDFRSNRDEFPAEINCYGDNGPYMIRWQHGINRGTVEFHPYEKVSGIDIKFAPAFRAALSIWSRERLQPHELIILPPIESNSHHWTTT